MFNISHHRENGLSIITLEEVETGYFAEVTPECCAGLHAFGVVKEEKKQNVIKHYETLDDFRNYVSKLGNLGCKLSPFVCRLREGTYSFDGKQYQIEHLNNGKHAIHGLLYNKAFEVTGEKAAEEYAEVTMQYVYKREDRGFPFDYDCIVIYRLQPGCKLSITTKCVNRSSGPIPMQDGWHPYFDLGGRVDDWEMTFPVSEKYVFDHDLLPTGEKIYFDEFANGSVIGGQHIDNSFLLDHRKERPVCSVVNRQSGLEVKVIPSASYPILQIYTPPDRKSIAIENLSGPPNAFNMNEGFVPLESGQTTEFEMTFQIKFI